MTTPEEREAACEAFMGPQGMEWNNHPQGDERIEFILLKRSEI